MKKIFIVIVLIIGTTACDKENVTSSDLSGSQATIERDMIVLANSIRYTTRINAAATERMFQDNSVDVQQLEQELIIYHENNGIESFRSDYHEFSKSKSTIELDAYISNLLSSNESGRVSENITLNELLLSFLEGLKGDVSENIYESLRILIKRLNKITNDYQEKLNSLSELVDGERIITSYDEEEYVRLVKAETGLFENEIVQNESILLEEKESIFYFTTVILLNIDAINSFYETFDSSSNESGRIGRFWKKIKKVFKKVASTVITVVVSAAYISKHMAAYGWLGPGAAIVAGVTGIIRGVSTSHLVSCSILNLC